VRPTRHVPGRPGESAVNRGQGRNCELRADVVAGSGEGGASRVILESPSGMEPAMPEPPEPLIERLLQAAYDHGTEEGADMEAGDLQEMLRAAWALLTREQQEAFFQRPEITAFMEIPEYE